MSQGKSRTRLEINASFFLYFQIIGSFYPVIGNWGNG